MHGMHAFGHGSDTMGFANAASDLRREGATLARDGWIRLLRAIYGEREEETTTQSSRRQDDRRSRSRR